MNLHLNLRNRFSFIRKYRVKWVIGIAFLWAVADELLWLGKPISPGSNEELSRFVFAESFMRFVIVFACGLGISYLIVFRFRNIFPRYTRKTAIILKLIMLIAASFIMNFIVQFVHLTLFEDMSTLSSLRRYYDLPSEKFWIAHGVPVWLLLFALAQLLIEIDEKYSPGVFWSILSGRYKAPQNEQRIIMFLDLKDSTPIAERLGHEQYFLFIRDFIAAVSTAMLEYDAQIYQYVGDEIVVSWKYNMKNAAKCIASVVGARKALQDRGDHFRRQYNIVPEFRAGLHAGEVTIGEIGIIKKDLAMSGDTMNTTARIRTACSELNQKYIVSKDFLDEAPLNEFQVESLGDIELKGKKTSLGLYALKV